MKASEFVSAIRIVDGGQSQSGFTGGSPMDPTTILPSRLSYATVRAYGFPIQM